MLNLSGSFKFISSITDPFSRFKSLLSVMVLLNKEQIKNWTHHDAEKGKVVINI